MVLLKKHAVVLFQGDSITDAGRDVQSGLPNDRTSLGCGYVFLLAARLLAEHADKQLVVYNRGVSGDTARKLTQRWQADCLDLKPNVLSLMVGVNDTDCSAADYETICRNLLDQACTANPELSLVLCEPVRVVVDPEQQRWIKGLQQKQAVVRKLAEDYQAGFVPLQSVFDRAVAQTRSDDWIPDGVHPSAAGHHLLAQAWLEATGL